ncbi:glycosyltransferase family 4 protein [Lysobacter sp. GCM10012299]|uniref:glycosyltransferase family 4 protein n=1 Tax=Lysobacter sp. GCM10012299 TaxID=3317333 RepID=UPI003621BA8C
MSMDMRRAESLRVTVIDMQPITPAVGGGRQRLLGLYHDMGEGVRATYVGTYDWPGEARRDLELSTGLREICVPLSAEHHAAAADLSRSLGGATVIDSAFSKQAVLSPEWIEEARQRMADAQVVIFSHPWCYPPLAEFLTSEQLVVYDAHNVEGLLKGALLGIDGPAHSLCRQVVRAEYDLCDRADVVLACSFDDAEAFNRFYQVPVSKLHIVPNGAFTDRFDTARDWPDVRGKFRIDAQMPMAIFLGSSYGPNAEAAKYIAYTLAPALPKIQFVIAGSVADALAEALPANVTVTGLVDDDVRDALLMASDVAVNPMAAGSGTNIKMFDFLAAGLPVVTTSVGARGICDAASAPEFIRIVELAEFPRAVSGAVTAARLSPQRKAPAEYARKHFSFERISPELGLLLQAKARRRQSADQCASRKSAWLFGTWNVVCGISEHTSYLAEALERQGVRLTIIGNALEGHGSVEFQRDLHYSVTRPWRWDNQHWRDSGLETEKIARLLEQEDRPDFVLIQHHSGFMPGFHYEQLVKLLRDAGVPTFVELHDAKRVSPDFLERISSLGATVFFHDEEEMRLAGPLGGHAQLMFHPVRVPEGTQEGVRDFGTAPIIGGFGFLRPYKGVKEAIRTIAALRHKFPDIEYRGWHALYPDQESAQYLKDCLEEARRLGVSDRVHIDTSFLAIDEVMSRIASVDLVLLPYMPSQEGASGAANLALATGRAIVTSSSGIFHSIRHLVHVAEGEGAAAYAVAVDRVLSDPAFMGGLVDRSRQWASEHSYDAAAKRILESVA